MKVCVLSESSADEAAIHILVEGLLKSSVELELPQLRSRGWPSVLNVAPVVFKHLHFHTDVDALVLVVDSNGVSVPHAPAHEQPSTTEKNCRLCQLRTVIAQARASVAARPSGKYLRTALGLAVPAVEAWYRFGLDPSPSESVWINGIKSKTPPYSTRSLKVSTYGTDRPSLEIETTVAKREARRIVDQGHLDSLIQHFPNGFGPLAKDIQGW